MSRRAPLFAVLAALLLAVLAWMFLITPERDERALLLEETEAIRTQQQRQRLEIARLEEIRDNELEVRAAIARLEQYIPHGPAQPSTIRQIQLAADASGVEITALAFADPQVVVDAPSPADPGSIMAQIPVTLTIEGAYFQTTDFMRRVETELARAVMVDSVTATEASAPAGFPTLSVSMTARIFTVVPVSAVPGAELLAPPEDEAAEGAEEEGSAA
ncbi:MAG TPA: type 4a pilus biogenesis protein PilO [Egibacteraceae bacterium]|nr:type 4a pilus biogenesis protein PilO [Egibacteraceae bacterium]